MILDLRENVQNKKYKVKYIAIIVIIRGIYPSWVQVLTLGGGQPYPQNIPLFMLMIHSALLLLGRMH